MIEFQWPWALAALPLPLLVRWLLSRVSGEREAALRVPAVDAFRTGEARGRAARGNLWMLILAALAWLALVSAAARPQWQGEMVDLPVSGRDLMLAVDISGSMQTRDFRLGARVVDRLTATKAVATQFIEKREGDRIGLVLFGRQAYLQTPLTFDVQTVNTLLLEAEVGFAGKETAIGDAIGLALKRLRDGPESDRVLILLTDGANTAGEIEPIKAAELAATEDLRVYTIGIGGDRRGSGFSLRGLRPVSDLDEDTLRGIAEITGGKYFRAHDTAELARIYELLDQLERTDSDVGGFRPRRALFYWPLSFALALAVGLFLWREWQAG